MNQKSLTLNDFDYHLPEERIAQYPAEPRDSAKLLLRKSDHSIKHHKVADLPSLLDRPCLFIINETKVRSARIKFNLQTGGRAELLLTNVDPQRSDSRSSVWTGVARPMKKMKPGLQLTLGNGLQAEIEGKISEMEVRIKINQPIADVESWLESSGIAPLPPYIHRDHLDPKQRQKDISRYQTVFARDLGSSAAPTAGLHFTPELIEKLKDAGHQFAPVTLHVGLGTFLPVKHDNIDLHKMHTETYCITQDSLKQMKQARSENRAIIAVGTTSLRCIYSFLQPFGGIEAAPLSACDKWHETDLFIRPQTSDQGPIQAHVDALMTNFHQPKSTLFMLICALLGYEQACTVYQEAMKTDYRFLSYGDSSLLWL